MLFDLDETVLDTSRLRDARAQKDWQFVSTNLHLSSTYPGEPEALLSKLRSEGLKVGVVTSSPRWYAEALLATHGIVTDVLVTGSDGYAAKPDPSSLLAAAEALGVPATETAHVGNDENDHHAAARAGMFSVGVTWSSEGGRAESWQRHWPDLTVKDPKLILEPATWDVRGPAAEVALKDLEPKVHWGSVIPFGDGMSLGRYFDTKDRRAAGHALSEAVLANKHAHRDAEKFASGVSSVMARLKSRLGGALVTSVPRHQEDDFDRFLHVRQAAAEALGGTDSPNLLVEARAVDNYKSLGPEERRAANRDRFAAEDVPQGSSILLIDDVFTFGDTLRACQRALLEAGAQRAYGLCLAHTQDSLLENCPECGRSLRLLNGRRGRFIGCTGWWIDGCPYTRDVEDI